MTTSTSTTRETGRRPRRRIAALPWLARTASDAPIIEAAPPEAITEASSHMGEVEQRDRWYRRSLAVADVVAVALAILLTIEFSGDDGLKLTTLLALPLFVFVAKLLGLYDRDELLVRKTTIDEAPRLFQLATLSTLVFWVLERLFVRGRLGNEQVLGLWLALWLLPTAGRCLARAFVQRAVRKERCVIVGDPDAFDRLKAKFEPGQGIHAELVGRMAVHALDGKGDGGCHELELRDLIAATGAHRLIIDPEVLPAQEMLDFVRAAKGAGVRVSLLPRILDVVGSSVVFDDLHGMTVLGVRRFGLTRSSLAVKRTFDLAGAGAVLLALGPLMALIAVLIKLDSKGPVLFRQTRIGRDGNPFRICKFRTMVADAEDRKENLLARNEAGAGLFKIAEDPRITRVGRILRRTSLDELAQLFNVMLGDMSLVGPRPLVVDEDVKITGWDRRRLQLTPGMTGQWQIAGSSRVPLHEMVKIDYVYVAGWSLWSDVKILLRTVPYVISRRGL